MGSTPHVVLALSIYAEPLVSGARVLVVGRDGDLQRELGELGARSVHLFDPDGPDLDVRDGAFDLAVVPDVGALRDVTGTVRRLRRVVGAAGAVVALGRARMEASDTMPDTRVRAFREVAPAAVGYAELFDVFAIQFEHVTLGGVLPFQGVVFAELGEQDDVAVSVDTRMVAPEPPGVFVVVASHEPCALDPYAIVQVPPDVDGPRDREMEAAIAATQLKANFLATQLEQTRAELIVAQAAASVTADRGAIASLVAERDLAATRAAELEGILVTAQRALEVLERRLDAAEGGMLERDDLVAGLRGELDALRREGPDLASIDPAEHAAFARRAEEAEAALALNVADLAHVAEAHTAETHKLEAQLRERAKHIASLEKEVLRREHLVRELVAALDEARDAGANGVHHFEPAPAADPAEMARLRRKCDELAMEIARREGELHAQAWRISELETQVTSGAPTRVFRGAPEGQGQGARDDLEAQLARARDEVDALRQALTQEHAARVAAESGEELTRARAALAEQAALLEQMRSSHPGG